MGVVVEQGRQLRVDRDGSFVLEISDFQVKSSDLPVEQGRGFVTQGNFLLLDDSGFVEV